MVLEIDNNNMGAVYLAKTGVSVDALYIMLVSCNYSHVKAHRDGNISYHSLSRPPQLNYPMDSSTNSIVVGRGEIWTRV